MLGSLAQLDRLTADTHCRQIETLLSEDFVCSMTDAAGNTENATLPALALMPPSLLYLSEFSIEIKGNEQLGGIGERLRSADAEDLSQEGRELRQLIAELGFNADFLVSGSGNDTTLNFVVYKDSSTMTDYIENWLEEME